MVWNKIPGIKLDGLLRMWLNQRIYKNAAHNVIYTLATYLIYKQIVETAYIYLVVYISELFTV